MMIVLHFIFCNEWTTREGAYSPECLFNDKDAASPLPILFHIFSNRIQSKRHFEMMMMMMLTL